VALPDGRTLWLFGDSFLGSVRPDGSRPADSPLIRNCLVVQDGERLETRHGGTAQHPQAFLAPDDPETWYWPGDGTVSGQQVGVFFHRFRQVSPGIWGWAWDATVFALLRRADLSVERILPAPDANEVVYGAALLEWEAWIYVFGTQRRGTLNHLHVARLPRDRLEGPWQFWTGDEWAPDEMASLAVLAGVGRQFGVLRLEGGVALVTMDWHTPFSNRIVLYAAETPTGPWRGPVEIYRAPEANDAIAAYNTFVHPQFNRREGQLISYNLNHVHDPEALYDNAALYRPRFIRADLARLAESVLLPRKKRFP
jgi:hypothetical protein